MESFVKKVLKIVCVIVKEGGPTGPPLGLKRIKYTLGPLGLRYGVIQILIDKILDFFDPLSYG